MGMQGSSPPRGTGEIEAFVASTISSEAEPVAVAERPSPLLAVRDRGALERRLRNVTETVRVTFRCHRATTDVRSDGVGAVTGPSGGA